MCVEVRVVEEFFEYFGYLFFCDVWFVVFDDEVVVVVCFGDFYVDVGLDVCFFCGVECVVYCFFDGGD